MDEIIEIKKRYARRKIKNKYEILDPSVYIPLQERERALIKWIKHLKFANLSQLKILEVGCGFGNNLMEFIKLGFLPENLTGNELIKESVEHGKKNTSWFCLRLLKVMH